MGAAKLNAKACALVAAIRATANGEPDVVPPDWLTMRQLAQLSGLGRYAVWSRLNRIPHERKTFRVICNRNIRAVPHYRLKSQIGIS